MATRLKLLWSSVESSLWFLPSLITVVAALLALAGVQIDASLAADADPRYFWVFPGGPEGARGILSAIAGSMITVTGVVFSLTIVALQLASSQFTPRVLRNFMGDRPNQVVLGVFIGTFTYSVLVLRSVRSEDGSQDAFVPALSTAVSVALVLASMGFLIYFIDHLARSIQASTVIDRAAGDALGRVEHIFPADFAEMAESKRSQVKVPETKPFLVRSEASGYLQTVDEESLMSLGKKGQLTVRMELPVGDFVLPQGPLASVWPASAVDDEVIKTVNKAFVLGKERTADRDLSFILIQLVDIAVKALSPGINDPTTAKICVDRLGQVLTTLGNREMPDTARTDDDGRLLFLARRHDYDHYVYLSFRQILHYGAEDGNVCAHLLHTLGRMVPLVPATRRDPLFRQGEQVLEVARGRISIRTELREVEKAGEWLGSRAGQMRRGYDQRSA